MKKEKATKIFKALGEKTNFLIVNELIKKPLCACEIPELIGRTQSNTSMHLSKLKSEEILKSKRDGKKIIYSVQDKDIKKIMGLIK